MSNLILPSAPVTTDKREKRKAKILILGHAGHGKTYLAQKLHQSLNLPFIESSRYMARHIRKELAEHHDKFYTSLEDCYEDRNNWRKVWFDVIADYNHRNGMDKLSTEIYAQHSVYVGMRNPDELTATIDRGIVNLIFYVDANPRVVDENFASMKINYNSDIMFFIGNSRDDKGENALSLMKTVINRYFSA